MELSITLQKSKSTLDSHHLLQESMECFKNAQQIVERHLSNYKLEEGTQEPSNNKYKALKLTLMFNIGYFHEQNYQLDEASNLYK
jgi:hypothetical protein